MRREASGWRAAIARGLWIDTTGHALGAPSPLVIKATHAMGYLVDKVNDGRMGQ